MSAAKTQAAAVAHVQEALRALRAVGWDFALVSIWRHDGTAVILHGAGASGWEVSTAIMEGVPRIADNLRALARELDEAHRMSGAAEVVHGCTHVVGGSVVDERARRAREGGA